MFDQVNLIKTIAVFTGTRAEYGLLSGILTLLAQSEYVHLKLWVGGTHLVKEFGHTVDYIEQDGFTIAERLNFYQGAESELAVVKSLAVATEQAGQCFSRNKPDLLVLLGDRYEALALAQAAMLYKVPIAHIHGGEITEGAVDNSIRHAISKMAHLHFVAAEPYRKRLIQMGELPHSVFNVGAPGLDILPTLTYRSTQELTCQFSFDFTQPYFLVTYHPVTLDENNPLLALQAMLDAFEQFPELGVVITFPNADTFSDVILEELKKYQASRSNVLLVSSMGRLAYLSAMKYTVAVIGNSSSGIIEAPSMQVPTVNIGERQKGRLMAKSVFSCDEDKQSIIEAITKALLLFSDKTPELFINPYGGNALQTTENKSASEKIVEQLIAYSRPENLSKSFYDLEFSL